MSANTRILDPVLLDFSGAVGASGLVSIEGARTRWSLGGELEAGATVLRAPSGIVDYVPDEMTVQVLAGTTVEELHATLAEHGQWTALPERGGTVGGAVVVGQNDFRKPARGDVRSAILRTRYVSADGKLISGGGPTVKNVSGFDIPRLITGSLGTLCCLAEVIVRTNPRPAVIAWFECEDTDPFAVRRDLLAPGAILWNGSTTTVMLTGHRVDVDADVDRLAGLGSFAEVGEPDSPTGFRWSLEPAELRKLDQHDTGAFTAEIGVGLVHAGKPQPRRPLEDSLRALHERMKSAFDPTGRLNPGRVAGAR